MAIKIM
jgi:hypothetical protein